MRNVEAFRDEGMHAFSRDDYASAALYLEAALEDPEFSVLSEAERDNVRDRLILSYQARGDTMESNPKYRELATSMPFEPFYRRGVQRKDLGGVMRRLAPEEVEASIPYVTEQLAMASLLPEDADDEMEERLLRITNEHNTDVTMNALRYPPQERRYRGDELASEFETALGLPPGTVKARAAELTVGFTDCMYKSVRTVFGNPHLTAEFGSRIKALLDLYRDLREL